MTYFSLFLPKSSQHRWVTKSRFLNGGGLFTKQTNVHTWIDPFVSQVPTWIVSDIAIRWNWANLIAFQHRRVPAGTELTVVQDIVEQFTRDSTEFRLNLDEIHVRSIRWGQVTYTNDIERRERALFRCHPTARFIVADCPALIGRTIRFESLKILVVGQKYFTNLHHVFVLLYVCMKRKKCTQ